MRKAAIAIPVIFFIFVLALNASALDPVFSGTVAYWKMDEASGNVVSDSAGNYSGVASGAAIAAGKINNGRRVNGSGGYIDTADIDFATGGFALSAWFRTNSTARQWVMSKSSSGTNQIYMMIGYSGTLWGGLYDGTDWQEVGSIQSVRDGNWHHALLSVDSSTVKLYIDGVLQGTDTHDNSFPTNNVKWTLGARSISPRESLEGTIDEAGIWSMALTSAEVGILYNNGNGLSYDSVPSASASANPSSGFPPLVVNFSGNVAGGDAPLSYLWDFKDGGNSTLLAPSHTFASPGSYNVSFTVTDGDGDQSSAYVLVAVSQGCVRSPPVVSLFPSQGYGVNGSTVHYQVYVTNTDSSDCGGSWFGLTSYIPGGWSGSFLNSTPFIPAGGTEFTFFSLTSSSSAAGNNAFLLRAYNFASGLYGNNGAGAHLIVNPC